MKKHPTKKGVIKIRNENVFFSLDVNFKNKYSQVYNNHN